MTGALPDGRAWEGALPARVARYAQGPDYHHVLRERLKQLGDWLRNERPGSWGRAVVDTAPLLERDFARRAGLGWFGKNTMLIHPRRGSWFVLGGLLCDVELAPTGAFEANHCGTCTACLDACPTGAFVAPHVLDARRCTSYLTIELRRDVPEEQRPAVGDWLFGCDICQEICPWNRKAPPGEAALAPRGDLAALDARELLGLSESEFMERFQGTALYPRPGRAVVLRNAALVLGNTGDASALPALRAALGDDPLVREAAAWAIERIEGRANG
jgi:epoxyqueuosine reductase